MTQDSRFWTGISTGDAGPYSFENMNEIFRYLMDGSGTKSGVFKASGSGGLDGLRVTQSSPAAASVTVNPGAALVHGSFYKSTANEILPIAANSSGNPRIDRIVLTKLWATQTVRLEVLQGTPAGSPVTPSLTTTDGFKWQFLLADIQVANGFVTIVDANITNLAAWVLPVSSSVIQYGTAYTATLTTFVDVHASTNLSIVINSTKVRVSLQVGPSIAGGGMGAYAVRNDALATDFLVDFAVAQTTSFPVGFTGIISGLTPGLQTFRPRMRNVTGVGSVTVYQIAFMVEEIRE